MQTIQGKIKHIAKNENGVSYIDPYGKSTIDFSLLVAAVSLFFSSVAVAEGQSSPTNDSDRNLTNIPIAVPLPERYSSSRQEKSPPAQTTIPIAVPQPEDKAASMRLPVPNVPIPKGNLNFKNHNFETKEEILYRVIVESRDKELVRSLYPDAFNLIYRGKSVLQVGLFAERSNAIDARESLRNLGLEAKIVD